MRRRTVKETEAKTLAGVVLDTEGSSTTITPTDPIVDRAAAELAASLDSMINNGDLILIEDGAPVGKTIVVTAVGWEKYTNNILELLEQYHSKFPIRVGIARAELRQELDLTPKLFNSIIGKLKFDCVVEDSNKFVSKFGYKPVLTKQQSETINSYLAELKQKGYSPSTDIKIEDDILVLLENQNRV